MCRQNIILRMKIVHLSNYYQPQLGYQEPNLVKSHAQAGHEVHVITADRYYPFPHYQENYASLLGKRIVGTGQETTDQVTIHRLPIWFEYQSSAFLMLRYLKRTLHEIKPDIVFVHDIFTPTAYLAAKYQALIGYTLVYDVHESANNTNFKSFAKQCYLRLWQTFFRPVMRKYAQRFIAIGPEEQEMASELLKIAPKEIPIIPLGADTNRFAPDSKMRSSMRQKLKINENDRVIVYAGKMSPDKNIHLLLESFGQLPAQQFDCKLLLIGRGEEGYEQTLKTIIEKYNLADAIIRREFVANNELPPYLNAADIGVWPGSPSNGIQEAVACGLPIVIRANKTTKFLVRGTDTATDNGFIFDPADPSQLLDALRKLIQDPALRTQQGKLSRQKAEQVLDWNIIAAQFLDWAK